MVRTDISRFYPSIYTHSIPWAAYGKETVKGALNVYDGSLADRLDILVRACNRNQTIGLPIGPETSRILAEIISSRIDSQYANILPGREKYTVDRLQDDWVVGAKSLEDAQKILSVISLCYRDYGLEINGSKTSVTHILASGTDSWKSEISAFLSHRREGLNGSRLEEFLSLCLRLQLSSPSEPVMNYSLTILEGRRYSKDDAQSLEFFLLKAAAVAPGSLDRICRIILNMDHETGALSRDRLSRRFLDLAERHLEKGELFEVIWLLYTIRGLKKTFSSPTIMELAKNSPSSALRLLLMDMKEKGICVGRLPIQSWENDLSEQGVISDWTWLYGYEAIRKGWIGDPKGLLSKPFFKSMHQRDIVFYDPKKNIRTSQVVKKVQINVMKRQNSEIQSLLRMIRGVDQHFDIETSDY